MGWCGGIIGSKGKICLALGCTIASHKKKAGLKPMHWYTKEPSEYSVHVSPILSESVASKCAIWSLYQKGLYRAAGWDAIMSYCKSNVAAKTFELAFTR